MVFLRHQFWFQIIGGSQRNIRFLCTECLWNLIKGNWYLPRIGLKKFNWMTLLPEEDLALWYVNVNVTCNKKAVRVLVVCPLLGLISNVQWQNFQLLLQLTIATKWVSKLAISAGRPLFSVKPVRIGTYLVTEQIK